jgi:hypothetical protein
MASSTIFLSTIAFLYSGSSAIALLYSIIASLYFLSPYNAYPLWQNADAHLGSNSIALLQYLIAS